MFSILPDLTPRDSHSLWYVSARNPIPAFPSEAANSTHLVEGGGNNHATAAGQQPHHRRQNQGAAAAAAQALERTPLARLRADELHLERRRQNVSNFGATWLKPPGVTKSLFQMREEQREQEEHAEALRREQLQQQLAEAEGAGGHGLDVDIMDEGDDGEGGMLAGDGGDGERDLDDEIPDADADGFGFDGVSSSQENDDDGENEEDEDDEDGANADDVGGRDRESLGRGDNGPGGPENARAAQRREARQTLAAEDRVIDMMTRRAQQEPDDLYAGEEVDEEEQADMLQEDELVQADGPGGYAQRQHNHHRLHGGSGVGLMDPGGGSSVGGVDDMDMDADLDGEVPEAEDGGYEHTDSDASLSSSNGDDEDDDEHVETSFALGMPSASSQFAARGTVAGGGGRDRNNGSSGSNLRRRRSNTGGNPRSSIVDISGILSGDDSSISGSSPQVKRRN